MMPFMVLRDPYQPKDFGLLYLTRRIGEIGVPSSIGIITLDDTERYEREDARKAAEAKAAAKALHRLPKRLRK